MSTSTKIEWTRGDDGTAGATWNPVTGCTKVSGGCDNCYAETFAERWRGVPGHPFEQGFDVRLWPARLTTPLTWRKPRRVFVNSMSDLFHDAVPDEFIAKIFAVMAAAPEHTFQILTKRHGRMRALLSRGQLGTEGFPDMVEEAMAEFTHAGLERWPLPNVWLGVSVENQRWADIRIPALLETPASVRFLSAEPLLGPVDLTELDCRPGEIADAISYCGCDSDYGWCRCGPRLDWVIVGGESGPKARPMHPAWARSLRDQCQAAGVAFFFKQRGQWTWDAPGPSEPRAYVRAADGRVAGEESVLAAGGEWAGVWRVGKGHAGRELDGRTWDEFPAVERVAASHG